MAFWTHCFGGGNKYSVHKLQNGDKIKSVHILGALLIYLSVPEMYTVSRVCISFLIVLYSCCFKVAYRQIYAAKQLLIRNYISADLDHVMLPMCKIQKKFGAIFLKGWINILEMS